MARLGSHFDLRLSEELQEELAALARRQGKSVSAVCRELMQSALDQEPDLLREKLRQSLARLRTLLLHAEDAELLEDVGDLVGELDDREDELEEEPESEHESEQDGEDESK